MECVADKKMVFPLGKIMVTYRVNLASDSDTNFRRELWDILNRFRTCDFGLTDGDDELENLASVKSKMGHVLAKYNTTHGDIFVNTDFDVDEEDIAEGALTTVMFVEEY